MNARVFVDRKNNEEVRAHLKDLEDKRQNQKDQERDYTRDIYQLAKEYKRTVDEFNTLLLEYSAERNGLYHLFLSYQGEFAAEKAMYDI